MTELFLINNLDQTTIDLERTRVLEDLANVVYEGWIHEVGSTAVDGVVGKQDLDFLVRVPEESFIDVRQQLDECLARNSGQLSNDTYQGYIVASELDVAVQLTVANGPHDTFLEFLALLKGDATLRDEYNQLKRSFHGLPMADYRNAKRDFIERSLRDD